VDQMPWIILFYFHRYPNYLAHVKTHCTLLLNMVEACKLAPLWQGYSLSIVQQF